MTDDADGRALVERLRAERDERRRLAELIHDGPVQLVAAITQMLDAAHHALEAGDLASGTPIVERALGVAREASVDLREIVSGIEPDALRELGLAAAIAELTERHTARRGVSFQLDVAAGDDLGEGAQSGLYQIVRDALDQAVRRGPPGRASVSILPALGGIELTITDNGAQERRETVLAALGERVAELNGTFTSQTNVSGTRISIRLPPTAAQL
ncbi:histidine kinase [Gaiella sp.]|uniref:sensor histidine kinase n=1 Tax=Gaiella sp. TaxID=2663207 RepID=UPI003266E078